MKICVLSPAAVFALALSCTLPCSAAQTFGFTDVALQARQLATKPFRNRAGELPKELQSLNYARFQDIRFRPDRYYWRAAQLPFEVSFVHEGMAFNQPVKINEVSSDGIREIKFDPDDFDYGATRIDPKKMRGLGFAGFRIHYALTPKYKDEVLVFLGASYFRAVGNGQRYGLSARGLAVDTGLISGEEFPHFVEFWIKRPAPSDRELIIYGLLDSKRMTGAYRFVLKPGTDTAIDVKARIYLRENVGKLGLAPLTSMYFYGENQRSPVEDYRPEEHDSDGLSILSGTGEWIWRPLVNPKRLLITSFAATNPAGFGLMQRDRAFSSYEDLDARYELRPSTWVTPKGRWGSGRVELVQIPTPDETNDNIVAFWITDKPPQPGQPYDFEYRLLWQKDHDTRPPSSWVTQTRRGYDHAKKPDNGVAEFVVDFSGPALKKLSAETKPRATVSADANGELLQHALRRNDAAGGWRLTLRVKRLDNKKPVELRANLSDGDKPLSETWSYIIPAD